MMNLIQENLSRQLKGLSLLKALLEEEFSRLMKHDALGITPIELSVQELMRQLAAERISLKAMVKTIDPDAERIRDIVEGMGDGLRTEVEALLQGIDRAEQDCGMQAHKNQQMVLALYDQSTKLLNYMHKQISPQENKGAYSARGRYAKLPSGQASLVRGRF